MFFFVANVVQEQQAEALYDYPPVGKTFHPDDLVFKTGDMITIVEVSYKTIFEKQKYNFLSVCSARWG